MGTKFRPPALSVPFSFPLKGEGEGWQFKMISLKG